MTPRFHIDKDVAAALKRLLDAHYADPDCAVTAAMLGMHRASDGHHLLVAAQAERILVTHNSKDFIAMQDAWLRWQRAWGVAHLHVGILIIPKRGNRPKRRGKLSRSSAQERRSRTESMPITSRIRFG